METVNAFVKVNGPTVGALALSFSDVEQVLRLTALLLSIAWTIFNITSSIKPKGKK